MDEQYLNDLLNQVSPGDGQSNNDIDMSVYEDSDVALDVSDMGDISFDELDDLDSLDLSELDLEDIDFDDIDVTSLDAVNPKPKDVDADFSLDSLLEENSMSSQEPDADVGSEQPREELSTEHMSFDDEVFQDASMQMEQDVATVSAEDVDSIGNVENMDLDDLFAALGIEEEPEGIRQDNYTSGQDDLDSLFENSAALSMEMGDLDDIEDIETLGSPKKGKEKQKKIKKDKREKTERKKKTFSEILFGEQDEEDLEEERLLAEKKEQARQKKEQHKAEKEAKMAEKQEVLEAKKKTDAAKKKKLKDEKQQKRQKELEELLEEEKNEKKVSNVVVVLVFALFIALAVCVILGTKVFSYNQVIKRATDYFDRDRYRLAYDEVSGVEVKEKDEELRDRIYTVMYVERLYESYQNNMQLNRPDVALDALIRGLEKYDEHYEEAVKLQIVDDIDLCRGKIIAALYDTYRLTESEAYRLMELEGIAYSEQLQQYSEHVQTGE
ncbi:MAG: hypothetical protein Q4D54_02150 [Eubacteriales bacterium]|nr:hypothetical protein [Lachnospiraceae bacterium]MDO5126533.1 hypothetical protein [Eubacteriales bacterium]